MRLVQIIGMFCMGLRDSLCLEWIRQLIYVNPQNKLVHPSRTKMLLILKNSLIQVIIILIGIPSILTFIGYPFIASLFDTFFLLLTYGYLFFYNDDIMILVKDFLLWKQKNYPKSYSEIDQKQRIQIFTALSGNLKSFIFLLLYYLPIYIITSLLLSRITIIGPLCLLISQSFFNSAFYFLKKWPYDRYNIGFMEYNMPYMLGYGFFVSLVCNFMLQGSLSRAGYFLISIWMIINCVKYSPPLVQFNSFQEIYPTIKARRQFKNGYNKHRNEIRQSKQYRKKIISYIFVVKPAVKITQYLNLKLSSLLNQKSKTYIKSTQSISVITQEVDEE